MTSPYLWYLNRGTGVVLLVLFTLTVALGVLATRDGQGPTWWPRFLHQGLDRHLSLLSTLVLAAHVVVAVVDEYVDIRWVDALIPGIGSYRTAYLALGTVALDLTAIVVATSLARSRLPEQLWRTVHVLTYAGWLASVGHTVGIGTDMGSTWLRWLLAGCVGIVVFALSTRLVGRRLAPSRS